MTRPVSCVIPCLDDKDLLAKNLPALLEELERRSMGDEIIVVDDTGEAVLADWLKTEFPTVRSLSRATNGGFAAAMTDGVEAARHGLVFCMNPDVRVRPGFLDPLVACLDDPDVHSVTPRVLLNGKEEEVESVTEFFMKDGMGAVRQRGLEGEADRFLGAPIAVAYAIGGTCLIGKQDFLDHGFDPLFEPFYLEDLDLGWMAWRRGMKVLYQPASVVEHHHRGTISKRVGRELVVAMIERNRLLFQWKCIDEPEELARHLAALYRMAVDAWINDSRQELVWLALAIDQMDAAMASRGALPPAVVDFAEIRRLSSPRGR